MILCYRHLSLVLFFGAVFGAGELRAQPAEEWTLRECIDYALENNISVRQAKLQAEVSKNNLNTSQWDYAPNLSLGSNYGFNFGLNIDPVTNEISRVNRQTSNVQLSSTWTVFDGGRKYNRISQRNYDYMAALYQYEEAQNDIRLNVAGAYLDILLNRQIQSVAREQVRITQLQLKRMENMVQAGTSPKGDQLQLEAQLSREEQELIAAENRVAMSKLQLANLLQLEEPGTFDIRSLDMEPPDPALVSRDPESIYITAAEQQPGVKRAEQQIKSSEEGVDLARAGYLPTLSLVAQVGTNYSNQIPNITGAELIQTPIGVVANTGETVITEQPVPQQDGVKPFGDQVSDNLNEFVGINLSVPIFSRNAVRNSVENSRLQKEIAKLELDREKNQLRQEVYQAHADAKASYKSYLAAQKAVQSSREAFQYAEERFTVGSFNQVEFQNAKNNLANAQSEMAQAKYDYIFKVKVLDFYLTNSIQQ